MSVLTDFIVLDVNPSFRLKKWTVTQVTFRTPGGEERNYNFFSSNPLLKDAQRLNEGDVCTLHTEKNDKGYDDIKKIEVVDSLTEIPTEDPAKTSHFSRGTTPATRPAARGRPQSPEGIDYGYEDSPAKQRRIMKAVALDKGIALATAGATSKSDKLDMASEAVRIARDLFEPYLSGDDVNTGAGAEAVAEMLEG